MAVVAQTALGHPRALIDHVRMLNGERAWADIIEAARFDPAALLCLLAGV